jgi:hypothetical protein
MSIKLKYDSWIKRKFSPKIKEAPKVPLDDKQKELILNKCWEKCYKAYRNRMTSSGLMSDFETQEDLVSEAWIAMNEIISRFDLSKCGEVSEYDVPGDDKPKTLEFYFLNYFYGRVNFMACEARTHKKSRNVHFSNSDFSEIEYAPVDDSIKDDHEYEITGNILHELNKKPKDFQRFFYQTYILQCTYKELVDEYGQSFCKEKREEVQEFVSNIKNNYKPDYIVPYKEKGKRGRKKKVK